MGANPGAKNLTERLEHLPETNQHDDHQEKNSSRSRPVRERQDGLRTVTGKREDLTRRIQLLDGALAEGVSFVEICEAVTSRKNKEYAVPFSRTEFHERLVLLPQCLRSTENCVAEEKSAEYVCARCRSCKIAQIIDRAEELGYLGVRILKGGSAVAHILAEVAPRAVLGIACMFEGAIGILECEKAGIAVQFIPLLRDGCADTDVDITEVLEIMGFQRD
ncbi:DUF116 domain-containing protein [bacterium]|nr:DUF116 domain-containing protein [candidate division CSSED10-310 bacterium]